MTWVRSPYTKPKVVQAEADSETIYLEGTSQEVLLTAVVLDADNNLASVTVDLTSLNGDSAQPMYDDGTYGDVTAGDGIYSFLAEVSAGTDSGIYSLTVTATDSDNGQNQEEIVFEVIVPGEIVWDNGGTDSNWSTPENWSTGSVPGPGDKVAFNNTSNTDCIIDVNAIDVASLSLNYTYAGTVTLNSASMGSNELTLTGDLTVNSGTILCEGDTVAINEASGGSIGNPHGTGVVISAANITVGENGHISADGQGFPKQQGPSQGNGYAEGAGHGGRGGSDGGDIYGSISQPTALGSGTENSSGGSGGGAIKLNVSDTITINGTVSANGANAGYGGGAGGSIWIITDTLAGSGAITADGGYASATDGRAGGGGGGRISLQWNSGKMNFGGTIRAKGGLKNNGSDMNFGNHGTIYVYVPDNPDNSWKELWNASRHVKDDIALAPGEYTFDELHVDSGATLECQGDTDGTPTEGSGVIINAANMTIEENAAICANRLGFYNGQGPQPGNSYGEGAGHGGRGGSDGGPSYGSYSQPISLGSGGITEGLGGGAIKLNVSDTITVNGTVSANGGNNGYGGGAGGSIWIIADTLAGAGSITADGGYASATDGRVGGGGGGRISLQWNSSKINFSGTIRAKGGLKNTGNVTHFGSHGTIYAYVPDNPDNSWKELWNASRHVKYDIALPPGEYAFDELHVDGGVTLECQGDTDGTPTEGSGVIINATNITVEENAAISAYGLGFYNGQGPGRGTSYGKGGSHGGQAGGSSGVGPIYGSVSEPLSLGSGGASEGIGGGAIKLNVSDTLTINGTVSADAEDHSYGGGGGGSIWIITDTLAGSGSITADGGAGAHGSDGRVTGGGGGRIAVSSGSNTSSLTSATVSEGTGYGGDGELGTMVWTPIGGYTEENVIPQAQCVESDGIVTITFKLKDPGDEISGTAYNSNHTLHTFEYSVDGGQNFNTPTNGDSSLCLEGGWADNSGAKYSAGATFADAPEYGFTWNTLHEDLGGVFNSVLENDVRIRFKVRNTVTQGGDTYYIDSVSFVTSDSFAVDNRP